MGVYRVTLGDAIQPRNLREGKNEKEAVVLTRDSPNQTYIHPIVCPRRYFTAVSRGFPRTTNASKCTQAPGSSGHFLSKNSGFEGPKIGLCLSQNSGFEAIWRAGLSTNSGFEGPTERNFFEVPYMSMKARI